MEGSVSPRSHVARVRKVADEGCRLYIEYPSGMTATVDSATPYELSVDDVVLGGSSETPRPALGAGSLGRLNRRYLAFGRDLPHRSGIVSLVWVVADLRWRMAMLGHVCPEPRTLIEALHLLFERLAFFGYAGEVLGGGLRPIHASKGYALRMTPRPSAGSATFNLGRSAAIRWARSPRREQPVRVVGLPPSRLAAPA